MTDSHTVELADGLSVEYEPGNTTGSLTLTVNVAGEEIHSATVEAATEDTHHGRTKRGEFLNALKDRLATADVDAKPGIVKAHVEAWLEDVRQDEEEIQADLQGEIAKEIINGTYTPVEIHGASDNNTTFVVELEFRGRENSIEFEADALLPGTGPAPLESALMNQYFERVDIPDEDWEAIAEYWHNHSEVASVTETTAEGARANRVVEYLSDSIEPTSDKTHLNNSHRAAWVDSDGAETPSGTPAVWVQDKHFTDQIDTVASVDAKGPVCTELRKKDTLKQKSRRRWLDTDGTDRFWAFEPEAVGVDPDSFEDVETDGGVEI